MDVGSMMDFDMLFMILLVIFVIVLSGDDDENDFFCFLWVFVCVYLELVFSEFQIFFEK